MRINKRTKRFKKKVKKYEIELVKNIIKNNEKVNKKWLCKIFKISRWSVYYNKKQRIKDLKLKINVKLENILNPYYGHRRIAIYFFIKYSKLKKKIKKLNKEKSREITNLETQNAELKEINTNISNQLNELSKYESIVDAEAQAKKIIDKANEKSQITQDTARLILNDAIMNSERIIEEANIKAKQIADSVFEAK